MRPLQQLKIPIRNRQYRISLSGISLCMLLITACTGTEEDDPRPRPETSPGSISITTRTDIADNNYALMTPLELYVFDSNGDYIRKADIEKKQNQLTTELDPAHYQLGLLTCIDGTLTPGKGISLPVVGGSINNSCMWDWSTWENETDPLFLKPMPELAYDLLPLEVKDTQTTGQATLVRNVACIEVELKQQGFYASHLQEAAYREISYCELRGMPARIAWDGKLLPDRDNPDLTTLPLREYIDFDTNGNAAKIRFIVPAHRGVDHDAADPNDLVDFSPVKLRLQVCLPNPQESTPTPYLADRQGDGIEIDISPKMNRITHVTFNFPAPGISGELDVKVKVKDWEDITHTPEF